MDNVARPILLKAFTFKTLQQGELNLAGEGAANEVVAPLLQNEAMDRQWQWFVHVRVQLCVAVLLLSLLHFRSGQGRRAGNAREVL
eukprot:COSAG01_NODE_462_length_16681_cov_4.001206_15_plen_86_part_00